MSRRHPRSAPASRWTLATVTLATVTLATVAAAVVGCAPTASENDPRTDAPSDPRPLALVYDGPQGCPECAPAIAAVLEDAPAPFRVEFVGPGTGTDLTAEVLAEAELYVQPGGGDDLEATWSDLEPQAGVVRDWVERGGSYLGLCFGAYLAGRDPGFDLLPGDAFGWAGSPGASVPDERDTVIPVTWRGEERWVYFQDGPGFALRPGAEEGAGVQVLATYPNGVPAVLVAPYGAGRVGVAGPHPEADESWFSDAGLTDPDGSGPDLISDLVATTLARG